MSRAKFFLLLLLWVVVTIPLNVFIQYAIQRALASPTSTEERKPAP